MGDNSRRNVPEPREHLDRAFFSKATLEVARELLGAYLVRMVDGTRIAGIITETEAYNGEADQGCHARTGRSLRNQVMYGPPGHAYIYFTYGMHWLLNFVTETENFPAAVLIRSLIPTEGLDFIAEKRRPQPRLHWTNGPAKICQAFEITGTQNGHDLCSPAAQIFIERGTVTPESSVTKSARVGLYTVPEPWKSIPWRFQAANLDESLGGV